MERCRRFNALRTNECWELVAEKCNANGWQDGGADGEQHKEEVAHEVMEANKQHSRQDGDYVRGDAHYQRRLLQQHIRVCITTAAGKVCAHSVCWLVPKAHQAMRPFPPMHVYTPTPPQHFGIPLNPKIP